MKITRNLALLRLNFNTKNFCQQANNFVSIRQILGKKISPIDLVRETWGEKSTSKSLPVKEQGAILITGF
jgi:hypothetical protein